MYKIISKPSELNHDYRFVPMKNADENLIHIHISPVDGNLWLTISESIDKGFFFTDVSANYSDLSIGKIQSLDDAYIHVTKYFIDKGYEIINYLK